MAEIYSHARSLAPHSGYTIDRIRVVGYTIRKQGKPWFVATKYIQLSSNVCHRKYKPAHSLKYASK